MEYGSAFGHGAYLGPDYTADYLRRASNLVTRAYGGADVRTPPARRTIADFRTNRYDERHGHADADRARRRRRSSALVAYYSRFFSDPTTEHGLRPERDHRPRRELRQLTAFFAWTAWAASTNRPGHDYSYTNNWPPEPRVDNKPTANVHRLVGAVADRAARRHRPAVRRRSAAGAATSAGTAASRRRSRFRAPGRRRADAGAARDARGSSS